MPFEKPIIKVYLKCLGQEIDVSVVDIGNLTAFIRASDFGLTGTELPGAKLKAYDYFSELQRTVGEMCGLKSTKTLPFTVAVAKAVDYESIQETLIEAKDIDFCARHIRGPNEIFTGVIHKAFPGTGSMATSVAS